jgi:hypothetical protein
MPLRRRQHETVNAVASRAAKDRDNVVSSVYPG